MTETPVPDETTFDFDSFFVPTSDPGVAETVTVRGHTFTVQVKRGLTLGDREAAKAAATTTHLDPKGTLVVDGFNTGVFTVELLSRCILAWSLPRAVTRDNIVSLGADVADALMNVVQKYVAPTEEALAPFVPPSDAA